jgi:hypothetical protein
VKGLSVRWVLAQRSFRPPAIILPPSLQAVSHLLAALLGPSTFFLSFASAANSLQALKNPLELAQHMQIYTQGVSKIHHTIFFVISSKFLRAHTFFWNFFM